MLLFSFCNWTYFYLIYFSNVTASNWTCFSSLAGFQDLLEILHFWN